MNRIKHRSITCLKDSLIGVVINVTYVIGWRLGGFYPEFLPTVTLLPFSLSISLQNVIVAFCAALISAYVGLWIVGKVKPESPWQGIEIGLNVALFSLPIIAALQLSLYFIYAIPPEFFYFFAFSLVAIIFENILGSLLGGFFGGTLVEFVAPDYCPKCNSRLGTGVVYCRQCGWGSVEPRDSESNS